MRAGPDDRALRQGPHTNPGNWPRNPADYGPLIAAAEAEGRHCVAGWIRDVQAFAANGMAGSFAAFRASQNEVAS